MKIRNRLRFFGTIPAILVVMALAGGCSGTHEESSGVPGKITGTVALGPDVPLWMTHGTLTVVVMMKGTTSPDYLPVARAVFVHPTFPVPFSIGQGDVRLTGIDLKGPVRLYGQLSLESGSPLVASGEFVSDAPVEGVVGGKPVALTIRKELPSAMAAH